MLCNNFQFPHKNELKGGARGLVKLSLAECRAITNQGIAYLSKLRKLEELNVLGCYSVSDEGIEHLVSKSNSFKKFNLSGTYISRDGLNAINLHCKSIQTLVLHGCRLLSTEDALIFKNCHIELREDIFRFQLLPTPETTLNSITNNILRTRSSLTIQRVAHYVYKKLQQPVCNIDIVCKGRVLSTFMTLRDVERDFWDNSMLSLYYRLKEETAKILENEKVESIMGKMPRWLPDDSVSLCGICHERFWILLRKHHCRKCGKIFCKNCSAKRILIPIYGYTKKPVRVCDNCFE
jgi:FYVE zinc finger